MSVDDWARREAEEMIPAGKAFGSRPASVPHAERIRFADGIVHAFDALLSDEAVEAAAIAAHKTEYKRAGIRAPWWSMPDWLKARYRETARAALQAAVRAVTEGDTE